MAVLLLKLPVVTNRNWSIRQIPTAKKLTNDGLLVVKTTDYLELSVDGWIQGILNLLHIIGSCDLFS